MTVRYLAMIACVLWTELATAGNSRIYAARVDAQGKPMDASVWTEIAPSATGVQGNPNVAYYEGTFLVVWHDLRNGRDFDVLGVRLSKDGQVLDPSPLRIGTGERTQSMPDVTADDRGFMVVWGGFEGSELFPHVFAARVDVDGTVGEASAIASGASPQIVWSTGAGMHFVLYSSGADGNMSQTKNWLLLDNEKKVLEGSTPSSFVWAGGNAPNHYSVCSIQQSTQGWTFVTDHQSGNHWNRSIGVQRAINILPDGSIASDSPTYVTKTYIERYEPTPGGGALNWLDYHLNLTKQWPYGGSALAPDGEYCVAVWGRYHLGGMTGNSLYNSDLYAGRVDRWRPVEESPVPIATSGETERNPALAGDGNGRLVVVYEKFVGGTQVIVTRPLTVTTQIEVGPEVVLMGSSGKRRGFPAIAYAPGEPGVYLVVWQEGWHGLDG